MPRRIVDLSIYLENDVISDPPPYQPKISYIDHKTSVPDLINSSPASSPRTSPMARHGRSRRSN